MAAIVCSLAVFVGATAHAAPVHRSGSSVQTAPGCPSPRTCGLYALESYRWPVVKGRATLSFYVNPTQPWMSSHDAQEGIVAAARTWKRANPKIDVKLLGLTTALVATGDGMNEIGWGVLPATTLASATVVRRGGKVVEADITLNLAYAWAWLPCADRDGACTDAPSIAGIRPRIDVQAVVTHEIGHWLGLGHLNGPAASELTMYMVPNPGERKQDTLALGDVLGVRKAYPCRCPQPMIVSP
ncbi:MAG: hypothetical protein NVSMB57_04000 [Actinomycetota bacterium]